MKMLIAADGSAHSRKAIEQAAKVFANAVDLKIRIVTSYEPTVTMDAFAPSAQFADDANKRAHDHAVDVLAETEALVRDAFPAAAIEKHIAMDFAERMIVTEAHDWSADLVVLGSHGRGFWGRLTLGSVSDAVIHHAPCTVFLGR